MKILIAMPSKALKDPSIVEALTYLPRLRPPLQAHSLFTNPKTIFDEHHSVQRIEAEGVELLQKTSGYFRVGLCAEGTHYSSEQFSALLKKQAHHEPKVAFIIGGAFGLSAQVLSQCKLKLSLSAMTLPHRIAFLVLCEQLYRASEIMRGTAYHK